MSTTRALVLGGTTGAMLLVSAATLALAGGTRPSGAHVAAAARPAVAGVTPARSVVVAERLVEPGEELLAEIARTRLGPGIEPTAIEQTVRALAADWRASHRHGPDPGTLAELLEREQRLVGTVVRPDDASAEGARPLGSPATPREDSVAGTLRLLVIGVEFAGSDNVTDFSHPRSMTDRTCVTESLTLSGPLHNRIPAPGALDNNTLWLPEFEPDYYRRILFDPQGHTARVRPDLVDPDDGGAGIDISGSSLQAFYHRASGGRLSFEPGPAGVVAWVAVPHSEAWYGASACRNGIAPDIADMTGLPGNPRAGLGPRQLVVDAAEAIRATRPDFPWADYDTDGDGAVDHVILFHAGKDKANGGGIEGWQAIWAHSDAVDARRGGYTVDDGGTAGDTSDDTRLLAYTLQYEDCDPGVLIHEFGHMLGLPDLYDISRASQPSAEAWDPMGAASRFGKLNGTTPAQLSAWSRMVLGWADPTVITPTQEGTEVALGQADGAPAGTSDAIRVDLPPTPITRTLLPSGSSLAWWSNDDQHWADARLWREVPVLGGETVTATFDLLLDTQADADFLFVEVSLDGGVSYTQTRGYDLATHRELTTPDGYADPRGMFGTGPYGDVRFGYCGQSNGWVRVTHELVQRAPRPIRVRLRHLTDGRLLGTGALVDNFELRADGRLLLRDPVEPGSGESWRSDVVSLQPGYAVGGGWRRWDGRDYAPRYYLFEWRSANGFDAGLRRSYNTIYSGLTTTGAAERLVDVVRANVPGMVVWLRDTRFGVDNAALDDRHLLAEQSEGPKGGLLVVDSHPDPLRGPLGGRLESVEASTGRPIGSVPFPPADNWSGRVQAANAAFGRVGTPAFTLTVASDSDVPDRVLTPTLVGSLPPIPAFHDSMGYWPGVERLPVPVGTRSRSGEVRLTAYALADPDAGTVMPAGRYYPPRTPAGFTGLGAGSEEPGVEPSTEETLYVSGTELRWLSVGRLAGTEVRGEHTGHPGSFGAQAGIHAAVVAAAAAGRQARVRVWRSMHELELAGSVERLGASGGTGLRLGARVRNVGSRTGVAVYCEIPPGTRPVPGSASLGAVPVAADLETTVELVRSRPEGLEALAVGETEARALAWSLTDLDTGREVTVEVMLDSTAVDGTSVRCSAFTAEVLRTTEVSRPAIVHLPIARR